MQATDLAVLLQAAPEEHGRRCALAQSALESQRWPVAACGLRHAAAMSQEWASKARELADWCDAQAESGRTGSTVAPTLVEITEPGTLVEHAGEPTLQSLEAGLLSLAHFLGREHAVHTRRAMANVLRSQAAPIAVVA